MAPGKEKLSKGKLTPKQSKIKFANKIAYVLARDHYGIDPENIDKEFMDLLKQHRVLFKEEQAKKLVAKKEVQLPSAIQKQEKFQLCKLARFNPSWLVTASCSAEKEQCWTAKLLCKLCDSEESMVKDIQEDFCYTQCKNSDKYLETKRKKYGLKEGFDMSDTYDFIERPYIKKIVLKMLQIAVKKQWGYIKEQTKGIKLGNGEKSD